MSRQFALPAAAPGGVRRALAFALAATVGATVAVASVTAATADDEATLRVSGTVTLVHSETEGRHGTVVSSEGAIVPLAEIGTLESGDIVDVTLGIPDDVALSVGISGGDVVDVDSELGDAVLDMAAEPFDLVSEAKLASKDDAIEMGTATTPVTPEVDIAIVNGAGVTAAQMRDAIADAGSYWRTATNGKIAAFATSTSRIKSYTSALRCTDSYNDYLNEASAKFGRSAAYYSPTIRSTPRHLILVLPSACGAHHSWGLGTIGDLTSGGWVVMVGRSTGYQSTLIHELGHNLGLDHANGLDYRCTGGKVFVQNLQCGTSEYWDLYSPMSLDVTGSSADEFATPFIDAAHRAYLDGFKPGQLKTQPSGSKKYTLTAAERDSGTTAVKVVSPANGNEYYVEYRAGQAGDATSVYTWVSRDPNTGVWLTGCGEPSASCAQGVSYGTGVRVSRLIRRDEAAGWAGSSIAYPVSTSSSYPSFRQYALGAGERWVSDDGTIEVKVISTSSGGASVEIVRRDAAFTAGTPTIAGKATTGTTLVAKVGTWQPKPSSYAYQWYRGSTAIKGATGSKYVVTAADIGSRIKLKVTAKRAGFPAKSAYSSSTAVVTKAVHSGVTPKIRGELRIGSKLTADTTGWVPALTSATAAYQWMRDGKSIAGATAKTYTVKEADRGKRISVKVTSTQKAALWSPAKVTKTSAMTRAVDYGVITTAKPVVKGKLLKWKTLTVTPGTWSPSGVKFSYQWKRNEKPISGATSASYKLSSADVGKKISVTVTATKAGYKAASRTTNVGTVAP